MKNGNVVRLDVQPSKNGSLPLLYLAVALRPADVVINDLNFDLTDIKKTITFFNSLDILEHSGKLFRIKPNEFPTVLDCADPLFETRYSFLLASVIAVDNKKFYLPKPGGCDLGQERSVSFHLKLFNSAGFKISVNDSHFIFERKRRTKSLELTFTYPSVGATLQSLLLGISLGIECNINNVALEPEVVNFVENAKLIGADIHLIGKNLKFLGINKQRETLNFNNIPDRIEGGTLILAAIIYRVEIVINNIRIEHLGSVISFAKKLGCKIFCEKQDLRIDARTPCRRDINLVTGPYPKFPTDLQPIAAAVLATINGTHTVIDKVFTNRFDYFDTFTQMGVKIKKIDGGVIIVGGSKILNADININSIRSTVACYLLASLSTGKCEVKSANQIVRGHSNLTEKLATMTKNDFIAVFS